MTLRRSGLSLVEVLIVIGIIGILVGLTLPAVMSSRAASSRLSCQNNLKQIGVALHNYASSHGQFPPSAAGATPDAGLVYQVGWMALILAEMDQAPLYRASQAALKAGAPALLNPPHTPLDVVIKSYTCPADPRLSVPIRDADGYLVSYTSYIGIGGMCPANGGKGYGGMFSSTGVQPRAVTDGLSQTMMVGERPPPDTLQAGWWYPGAYGGPGERGPNGIILLGCGLLASYDPCEGVQGTLGPGQITNPCDRHHLWSLHPGGANILMADGSVHFLPYSSEPIVRAIASRNGGEVVNFP